MTTIGPPADAIVEVAQGRLRGSFRDGVRSFLGIPYAAPPVGKRRFAAPAPARSWSGVRDATDPGSNAPQISRPFPAVDIVPVIGGGWRPGDDYLTLDIRCPAGGTALPVMVFIHGGAFVLGSKDAPVQDGSAFARSGVVSVCVNYRLGVEGFLAIPGAPTNLGLRDQLAALRWVQDNIAAFGGDPGNVTAFGESAGAMSLGCLIASPLAKGLFRRAIVQSGHGSMVRPIAIAQRVTRKMARLLGVSPDVAGFRSVTVDDTIPALATLTNPGTRINLRYDEGGEPGYANQKFLPVVGDDVVPERPLAALARGAGAEVDLLIGTNAEEMNLYLVPTGLKRKLNGLLAWFMLSRVQRRARAILNAYRKNRRDAAGDVFARATSDLTFCYPARRYAEAHRGRTHFYEFDWRSPACGGELGACHGLELPFVFDTLATVTGPHGFAGEAPPAALARRIHDLWVAFARGTEPTWPAYRADARHVLSLETGVARSEQELPAAPFFR